MRDEIFFGSQHGAVTHAMLSEFRSDQPDCVLALWVDIGARIVLATDGDLLYPQERLDALCTSASRALSVPPVDGNAEPDHILFAGPKELRILLRDTASQAHALVCICVPDTDPGTLLGAMDGVLTNSRQSGRTT